MTNEESKAQTKKHPPFARSPYYKKGGRPRKDDRSKHGHKVTVRFSDDELTLIRAYAGGAKLPLAKYIRETVLGRKPRAALTEQEREIVQHLGELRYHLQQMNNYFAHDPEWDIVRFENENIIHILKGILGLNTRDKK